MRTSIFRDLLILVAIGLVILFAGHFLVKRIDFSAPTLNYDLPIDKEEQLGDLMKGGLWDNLPRVPRAKADSALGAITGRLLDALDSSPYRYHFTIIESDEVNAFTIPGGNIYIFSGLISISESPEEVAAVLAHEIGHAEKRHVVKKLVQQYSLTVLFSLLAGGDPSLVLQIIQHVVGTSFDREHEVEADAFALELLERSHIDPKYLGVFFSRLNDKDLSYNRKLEILMTHPHNDARIEKVMAYRPSREFEEERIVLDWQAVRESLEQKKSRP